MRGSEPHLFVVLGATGDLTTRKLLAALYRNLAADRRAVVLGVASGDLGDSGFRERAGEALAAAGVPFEVVPAVTAGVAASACAGIPVTHRREAVRATLVTAHEAVKTDGPQVRWDLMAADPHATILGYMGVTAVGKVVERLIAAGMSPDTPAAMIESGTTSSQRVVYSTLVALWALHQVRYAYPEVFGLPVVP